MNSLIRANHLFISGRHKEAFDAYMQVLRSYPDAIAASNIGYMYHRGISVMRDYKKAMAYYNAARCEDGGVAYFNMALMYLRGQGVSVDFNRAIECMNNSAEYGCVDAKLYLAVVYILGYVYDPMDIECISLIPFYRVIYRDTSAPLIEGMGYDPDMEDKRYGVVEADGDSAVELYRSLIMLNDHNPYATRQSGVARFMIGKAYIEGLGDLYDPKLGYGYIYKAAINDCSAEAAQYLLANRETACAYRIDMDKIDRLLSYKYFSPIMGNLGTPKSHMVELLLPKNI